MYFKTHLFCLYLKILLIKYVNGYLDYDPDNLAFDPKFYEDAIDPVLCEEHLNYIRNDSSLMLEFLDSGVRIPKGFLKGNYVDLGNYYQCLGINHQLEESEIEGKYCLIQVPLAQNITIPIANGFEIIDFNLNTVKIDVERQKIFEKYDFIDAETKAVFGISPNDKLSRVAPDSILGSMQFSVAVCIPKTCSTKQALSSLLQNDEGQELQFTERFCRLPNDKPWVPGDYIAIVIFSLIGFFVLLGTCYELVHIFVLKKDSKTTNEICKALSLYSNGCSLMNFESRPGTIECLDGIRTWSMLWVILGHTFLIEPIRANQAEATEWQRSFGALWVSSSYFSVDSFFTISGLLVVYTTAGKISSMKLVKNLHWFYIHRLLRMFPLLATTVLLHSTLMNHLSDGPYWLSIVNEVQKCRAFWWSALLHLQNYVNTDKICITPTWYLCIDVTLHIVSPAILLFVLTGKRNIAWAGLVGALLANFAAATFYNFINEFPSGIMNPNRIDETRRYRVYHYRNPMLRAPPFLIGMILGYILHLYSKEKIRLSKIQVAAIWILAFGSTTFIYYSTYPIMQPDWDRDQQTLDSLYNTFSRAVWSIGVGLMIFACTKGYGGPVNWFLCLPMWKLPARLSYAMYIVHMFFIHLVHSSVVTPIYFTAGGSFYKFLGNTCLTMFASFVLTLFIESPFNNFVKMVLGSGFKNTPQPKRTVEVEPPKEDTKQS